MSEVFLEDFNLCQCTACAKIFDDDDDVIDGFCKDCSETPSGDNQVEEK